MPYLHIGIDDADWEGGGCTTYVMYMFLKRLDGMGLLGRIVGLPRLVRLNPYVPFKTRGNAALAITIKVEAEAEAEDLVDLMREFLDGLSERGGKTSPGMAYTVTEGPSPPKEAEWAYHKCVKDVLPREVAERVARRAGIRLEGGRGTIGALAALGFYGKDDVTYELLAYRTGRRVEIDMGEVEFWDELTRPLTFLNVFEGRILIQPHGPDPVLFGIRGDSPFHVLSMGNYLAVRYGALGWALYASNQGTNAHWSGPGDLRLYRNTIYIGVVKSIGFDEYGHAHIEFEDGVRAIAYRHLRLGKAISKLTGCLIAVWGGYKPGNGGGAIYIEGLRVLHDRTAEVGNPKCPKCGSSMESAGKGVLRCKSCGLKAQLPKDLRFRCLSLSALPVESEFKHLMKPPRRIGLEGLGSSVQKPLIWIV